MMKDVKEPRGTFTRNYVTWTKLGCHVKRVFASGKCGGLFVYFLVRVALTEVQNKLNIKHKLKIEKLSNNN